MSRLQRDQALVDRKLPPGTRFLRVDGVPGWQYTVYSELGERFDLFLYHDGSLYQVVVVFPRVAGCYDTHDAHLWSDGLICLGEEGGLELLEHAYAKSVLWANGFSLFLRTGRFPFSENN